MPGDIVLGAGITGLTIGIVSGLPVYEAQSHPGGLCASYYLGGYRFEDGGGHWIFGSGEGLTFLEKYATMSRYQRHAGVFFPDQGIIVPYPIQNHRDMVPDYTCMHDPCILNGMGLWLLERFGSALCTQFFFPFHEKYTAGLWNRIAPQDSYKSPTSGIGYNTEFAYPVAGLDALVSSMALDCDVYYNKEAMAIDINKRNVVFSDGIIVKYDNLYSTIPLNQMLAMTKLDVGVKEDPHTSVTVLNIGGIKGSKCPKEHWLYIAQKDIPFYRIGIYSNVDSSFVPNENCVSFYMESAQELVINDEVDLLQEWRLEINRVVDLLRGWGFVTDVSVISRTYIDVAYTWQWIGSAWRQKAMDVLESHGIYQRGRYGRWRFQGIAASVEEGLTYEKR